MSSEIDSVMRFLEQQREEEKRIRQEFNKSFPPDKEVTVFCDGNPLTYGI